MKQLTFLTAVCVSFALLAQCRETMPADAYSLRATVGGNPVKAYLFNGMDAVDSAEIVDNKFEINGVSETPFSGVIILAYEAGSTSETVSARDALELFVEPGAVTILTSADSIKNATITRSTINDDAAGWAAATEHIDRQSQANIYPLYSREEEERKAAWALDSTLKAQKKALAEEFIAANPDSWFTQMPYYQTTKIYNLGNNVSLKCDVDQYGGVIIHNPNSIYTYADQTYANGTALPMEIALGDTPAYTMTNESDHDIQNRVNSALTQAQKQIVGDRRVAIAVIIDPQTGKVIELFFSFSKRSSYNQLPPSVFRQIEQNFLSRPHIDNFAVTDVGRQLNYIMFSWAHKFR